MTRYYRFESHARRRDPCRCDVCRADRIVRDVVLGIGIGLAAVGFVVGVWAWLVVIFALAGGQA
jgi:hypothetical protein